MIYDWFCGYRRLSLNISRFWLSLFPVVFSSHNYSTIGSLMLIFPSDFLSNSSLLIFLISGTYLSMVTLSLMAGLLLMKCLAHLRSHRVFHSFLGFYCLFYDFRPKSHWGTTIKTFCTILAIMVYFWILCDFYEFLTNLWEFDGYW